MLEQCSCDIVVLNIIPLSPASQGLHSVLSFTDIFENLSYCFLLSSDPCPVVVCCRSAPRVAPIALRASLRRVTKVFAAHSCTKRKEVVG